MKHFRSACVAAAISLAAGAVSAANLQFSILESRFYDPVGGNILSIDNSFGNPSFVRWGQDGLSEITSSGYDYASRPTPFTEAEDDVFALGSFTHQNNPITAGTSITGISMDIRGLLSIDGGMAVEKIFSFNIDHLETPNAADPCADGGANGVEPNQNGCADRVTISIADGSDTIDLDGGNYTLNILGFSNSVQDAEDGIFDSEFWSAEQARNNRILAAAFTENPNVVPLPAAGWLLLGGLGGLVALRRRQKKAA